MTRFKHVIFASASVVALAAGLAACASFAPAESPKPAQTSQPMNMPMTAAEHAAEAARYDQEALDLEAKAKRHAEMAHRYHALATTGSKQYISYWTLANYCDRLTESESKAATEARATAQTHRELSKLT